MAPADIVRFWGAVELFAPPQVERPDPQRHRYRLDPGRPLPWQPSHAVANVQRSAKRRWRHVVYLGIYQRDAVHQLIEERFGRDAESFDERPTGASALAAFVVSETGRPLFGSEVLSSSAWAAGRLERALATEPGALAALAEALKGTQEAFRYRLEELVGPMPDDDEARELRRAGHDVGRPLDEVALAACLEAAVKASDVRGILDAREIWIQSVLVPEARALDTDGTDVLNSFFLEDLARIAERLDAGDAGAALSTYLRPVDAVVRATRTDVRTDLGTVLAQTAPERVPLGHWPDAPERPLALGQQLAVSSLLREREGLFGVNGPPGTGKTTMLRDVIAALVVERASRLAELPTPAAAFNGRTEWRTGKYPRVVHRWRPELTGFELVVASANNGAVENISHEIPAHYAIDDAWRDAAAEVDDLSGIGSALLGGDAGTDDAWALVAARLGRQSHRAEFVRRFWWGNGVRPGASDEINGDGVAKAGLFRTLKRLERERPPASAWDEAVATFRSALRTAESLRDERQAAYELLAREHELRSAWHHATQLLSVAEQDEQEAHTLQQRLERELASVETERKRRIERRTDHRAFRPGLIGWMTSLGQSSRDWRARDRELADEIARAEHDGAFAVAQSAALAVVERRGLVDRHAGELVEVRARLDEARRTLGEQFPDASWWCDESRGRRESMSLWTDPEWNGSRSALFLAALRLHREFLRHVPKQMRQSLHAAVDVLTGEAPGDLDEETALAAWQALFFVVPVVSTTFASLARMFRHLGRESLGWVLIDEAGQATPQSAVGAIWRARRVAVVGDPLQLEPIPSLPFRAEQAIRRVYGVDESWSPSGTSAQRLADQQTALGTSLPDGEGEIWVGAPLTVHRRCDEPMFGLVNEIAYDNLMIHATGRDAADAFDARYPTLPESKWRRVTGRSP